MTTDENILKEMLDRATNPAKETVDELAVQMFCMVVRSKTELAAIQSAQDMIVVKVRSSNVDESIRAIELLEECMTNCGADFQDEVGKFRFLNGLIRLVSIKYQGDETPPAIKKRIMECLLLWTTEFPQKRKIRDAYDMLKKEGGVEHGNTTTATTTIAKRESALGIDGQVLSQLIQSGDPENYKRANLLIQHRVNQEARRTELELQHNGELQEVQSTVGLLNQMLDTYVADGNQTTEETINLIRDLFLACKKYKPVVQRLPELIESTDDELIAATLDANDLLQQVMQRYKEIAPKKINKAKSISSNQLNGNSNADLLSELLSDNSPTITATDLSAAAAAAIDPLAELHEIFGAASVESSTQPTALIGDLDLMSSVFANIADAKSAASTSSSPADSSEKRGFRELKAIDDISEQLFQQNLATNERIGSFKKEPEKVTLNDLVKERENVKPAAVVATTDILLPSKLVASIKETKHSSPQKETPTIAVAVAAAYNDDKDEAMLSDLPELQTLKAIVADGLAIDINKKVEAATEAVEAALLPLKHLSDIEISLDDVTPTTEQRQLLDDEDVKITLNFTTDRPSKHVSVLVISVVNKSKMHVKDFQFEASVKKPCKVRLLAPTDVAMPPCKPFRPATPINQVMLLLNPSGRPIDVTCIVGYKLGDDPDPIKESIVAQHIPYVE